MGLLEQALMALGGTEVGCWGVGRWGEPQGAGQGRRGPGGLRAALACRQPCLAEVSEMV